MERVTGIEPAWPAWKAGALPLSYTREGQLQKQRKNSIKAEFFTGRPSFRGDMAT